jgi:bacteriocin biosynthesis cyclodehydratase domain-containing protein
MSQPASRPVLAPGLRVLQRSRDELQVGLRPEVSLPATDPVRRTLGHLLRGEALPRDPESLAVVATLQPVLVDGAGLVADDVAPGDLAALALRDPAGYPDRLTARRRARIGVSGTLGPVDPGPLLAAAGVATGRAEDAATAVLVLSLGEVDRAVLDPLLRDRVPHLLVRLVEGDAVVGPFVDPGRTACLRCLDAHAAADDPRGATLGTRHARAALDRHDGVAEPVDTALATLAVAWAVRDLLTHVEGDRPSTWSATVRLTPTLAPVTHAEWLRHPACGCSWLPDDQSSRTMSV